MAILYLDDFDRVDNTGLGSAWDEPYGTYSIDGDRANTAGNSSSYYAILSASESPSSDGRDAIYSVRALRAADNDGSFETGIVFGALDPASWSGTATGRQNFELAYSSFTGEMLIRARGFDFAASTLWNQAVTWNEGEFHQIGIRVVSSGPNNAAATVYFDSTELVTNFNLPTQQNPSAPAGNYTKAGLMAVRTLNPGPPPSPLFPPGVGVRFRAGNAQWDLFTMRDLNPQAANFEAAPTVVADPTLTSVVVPDEGTSITTLAIPPDAVYVTDVAYATNKLKTTSGHMVRHPRLKSSRRFWEMRWSGVSTTTKDNLLSSLETIGGSLGVLTWTPDGGSTSYDFAFFPGSMSVKPAEGGTATSWDVSAIVAEIK